MIISWCSRYVEPVSRHRVRALQAQRRALALMAVSDISRIALQSGCDDGTTSPSESDLPAPVVIDIVDAPEKPSMEERGMAEGMLSTTVHMGSTASNSVHMLVFSVCCEQLPIVCVDSHGLCFKCSCCHGSQAQAVCEQLPATEPTPTHICVS